jgi:hypothetical protein
LLRCTGACLASLACPKLAEAAVFRALSLEALLVESETVSVVIALAAECHYETIGSRRVIVTDTRVRIERTLGGRSTADSECLVRSLGGIVGERGELVDGQAVLPLGRRALVFLGRSAPSLYFVTGMAQGHFPLVRARDGIERLRRSPHLPRLLSSGTVPAAELLVDRTLDQAASSIRSAER